MCLCVISDNNTIGCDRAGCAVIFHLVCIYVLCAILYSSCVYVSFIYMMMYFVCVGTVATVYAGSPFTSPQGVAVNALGSTAYVTDVSVHSHVADAKEVNEEKGRSIILQLNSCANPHSCEWCACVCVCVCDLLCLCLCVYLSYVLGMFNMQICSMSVCLASPAFAPDPPSDCRVCVAL